MTDRRILRTRALLQDALKAMIIEHGYEGATVQHIIDRAGVSRSTFYAHFADKETLLVSGLTDLRKMLLERRPPAADGEAAPPRGFSFSLAMLRHAESHLSLYRAMVGRASGAAVTGRIATIIEEVVAHELGALGVRRSHPERDLMVQHVTGSFMGVLTWWLGQGAELPPEDVDRIFSDLTIDGLGARLQEPGSKTGQGGDGRR